MDPRFSPHNTHLESPEIFAAVDPHLRVLARQPLVHQSYILDQLPTTEPGIYSLSGGRQIGKTTLMKQWMARLFDLRIQPRCVAFLTGELIDDHHSLVRMAGDILKNTPTHSTNYLILDEVTYIKDWDKGVKYLADAGMLERTVMIVTGSDMGIIKEARMRFPGRRGKAGTVDLHLYPLSFMEFIKLHKKISAGDIDRLLEEDSPVPEVLINHLYEEFESYLSHGGFLTGINDMASHGKILPGTFATYSDWIRGDMLKRNKQEHYLIEILQAIIRRYGSQVSWNALSRDLSIDHPKTVADYIALLESMDAVFVQSALAEDKLAAAPKKAKKVYFTDPFIFHAVNSWLRPCEDPFKDQVEPLLQDQEKIGTLIESCAVTLYGRYFPTFYIKAKGEVDIAYVEKNRFWPVEVKWTGQLRPKQLSQIRKYDNGLILTRSRQKSTIQGIPTVPLPLGLLKIGSAAPHIRTSTRDK
jgi:predicted AAA+ superfamily ATPase